MASKNTEPGAVRRSARLSSGKVFNEPTPREPIKTSKTTKRGFEKETKEKQSPVAAVNGSRDVEDGTDDEETPTKVRKLEARGRLSDSGDEIEMDQKIAEDEEENEDDEMEVEEDSSHDTHRQKICQGGLSPVLIAYRASGRGDWISSPRVELSDHLRHRHAVNEDKREKQSTKEPQKDKRIPPTMRHDVSVPKKTFDEYRSKMEGKIYSPVSPNNHITSTYPTAVKPLPTRQRQNNIPAPRETVPQKTQGKNKNADNSSSPRSSRGCMWYFWRLVLMVLLGSSAALLAYKITPVLQRAAEGEGHPPRVIRPEKFEDHLSSLETQFASQRPEVWKRSRIHLEKHLRTAEPTEPVSLILTAGLRAERTMLCLAQGLATAFASALNASVLHIDGASKANQDSDMVKLDIDSQFQAAFEGDKPVAIIHRFEELPPGSTLIFYRYCDHEHAAYKRVFMLFTVLLPQDEVRKEQSLKEVEEAVQDYIRDRLVGSSSQNAFNEMDIDKYSGLWSRISHLILPVVSEDEVDKKGC